MLLDHVVVVEQPLAGGANVGYAVAIGVGVAHGGEPAMGVFQDAAGIVEPSEERSTARLLPYSQSLARGHLLSPLRQVLGTEQLAANGAGEAVLAGIRADEGHDEGE